ncbi:MAG: uridine kinase [Anaerorhabdus sp.]
MNPIIIGIGGGSASGKSEVAKAIKDKFEESNAVVIICLDDYYFDQSNIDLQDRTKTNYDHPLAIESKLLISHLIDLKNKKFIKKPLYDFVEHTRSKSVEIIKPCDVIVVEGLFVLENADLRDLLDIKIFVDTDADIRFIRRLQRDLNERGRSLESIINQYTNTVRNMHDLFVEPSKKYADVIITNGGKNKVAVDLLITKINSIINSNML